MEKTSKIHNLLKTNIKATVSRGGKVIWKGDYWELCSKLEIPEIENKKNN